LTPLTNDSANGLPPQHRSFLGRIESIAKNPWNFFMESKTKVAFSTTEGSREMQVGRGSARREITDK
jgi:hypothetical protein